MKKKSVLFVAALLVSFLLLVSCDDGSGNSGSSLSVAPPSWIIGTWSGTFMGVSMTYEFTSNDIVVTAYGYTSSILTGLSSLTEDVVSDTEYKITCTESDPEPDEDATSTSDFVKDSSTQFTLNGFLVFTKQ